MFTVVYFAHFALNWTKGVVRLIYYIISAYLLTYLLSLLDQLVCRAGKT